MHRADDALTERLMIMFEEAGFLVDLTAARPGVVERVAIIMLAGQRVLVAGSAFIEEVCRDWLSYLLERMPPAKYVPKRACRPCASSVYTPANDKVTLTLTVGLYRRVGV